MSGRGGKNLIFLSRYGAVSQEAEEFLAWLQSCDVQATVVKGDVASEQDVQKAIHASSRPIKGVIQAPLHLNVSFNRRELSKNCLI
jgi:hypothetical protein